MTVYAAPAGNGKLRIAIVVTGLGLSAKATEAALAGLPSAVTVGVLPYASDEPHWLAAARTALSAPERRTNSSPPRQALADSGSGLPPQRRSDSSAFACGNAKRCVRSSPCMTIRSA